MSVATGWPVIPARVTATTKRCPDVVIIGSTVAPALRQSRATSTALYAAMLPVTASAMVRPSSALMRRLLEVDHAHRFELCDQLERFGCRHRAYVEDLLERLHTVDVGQEEARSMIDGQLGDLLWRLAKDGDAVAFGQRQLGSRAWRNTGCGSWRGDVREERRERIIGVHALFDAELDHDARVRMIGSRHDAVADARCQREGPCGVSPRVEVAHRSNTTVTSGNARSRRCDVGAGRRGEILLDGAGLA